MDGSTLDSKMREATMAKSRRSWEFMAQMFTPGGSRGLRLTIILCLVVGGMYWYLTTDASKQSSASANGDVLSPCNHFRDIDQDIAQGILTDMEIRGKAEELRVDALVAPTDIQMAVTEYLSEATTAVRTGDRAGLTLAGFEVSRVCSANGA
jgi:hypothetical protein